MKKLPGEYVDVNSFLKSISPAYSAVMSASQMKDALGIMTIGTTGEPVNLVLSSDLIILRRNSDYSEAHSTVLAKVTNDTPREGFYYDASALMKLFQVIDGKTRLELDTNGFMMVKTRNEVYCQAPMRNPVTKTKPAKKAASNKSVPQAA